MKIAIVSSLYTPVRYGGAEVSAELLAASLAGLGHQVSVLTLRPSIALPAEEIIDGVLVHRIDAGLPYAPADAALQAQWRKALWHGIDLWNPVAYRRALELFAADRPDLLHTNVIAGFSPSIWYAARRSGVPVVHTVRDFYLACVRSNLCRADGTICKERCSLCRCATSLHKRASRIPVEIVGVTRFMIDKHREFGFFVDARTSVIHNASDGPSDPGRVEERAAGEPLRVVYMGRMEAVKGPQILAEAVASNPDLEVRVRLCGRGELSEPLRSKYAGDRRIVFEGYVDGARKQEILQWGDVMVIPSLWLEPFNRSVTDAYANGMTVVASRVGGLPEIVDEGATGELFDPVDARRLGDILSRLSTERARLTALQRAAAARSREFTLGLHTERYLNVYRRVTGNTRPG